MSGYAGESHRAGEYIPTNSTTVHAPDMPNTMLDDINHQLDCALGTLGLLSERAERTISRTLGPRPVAADNVKEAMVDPAGSLYKTVQLVDFVNTRLNTLTEQIATLDTI